MHKGIASERIVVTGESGHSSDPSFGRNAMEGMHAVIGALMDWRAELARRRVDPGFGVPVTTLNLGRIAGGDNPNRICGRCELDIDLRMLPGMDPAALRAELLERCHRALEGTGLALEVRQLMKPVPPMLTAADAGIVRMAERLTGSEAGSVAFATEAPFLASLGMDVVVLGPGSIEDAHREDEFVDIARLPPMLGHLAALIGRYCIA
jgi:acetylornithine deacetylase